MLGARNAEGYRPWLTVSDAAAAIRSELERGDDDFALRLVARTLAEFRKLTGATEVRQFLAPPPSTGSRPWDTLLAAVISRECRQRAIPAPEWTVVPPLDSWWFPDDDPLLLARTMQRTPVDLRVKGIWLDAAALESL